MPTEFLDGPAAGISLSLRRAPGLLRVVFNPLARADKWDALDQLDDAPTPHEQIHVYRCERVTFRGFICVRGKGKSGGGYFEAGRYRYAEKQPADAIARDVDQWRQWCGEHGPWMLGVAAHEKTAP